MIVTNAAHLPVALVLFSGDVTLDDVAAMARFYDRVHARGSRFATLVDARRARAPSPAVRRAMADVSNKFGERSRKNLVTVSVVLDSKLLVGALTAVRWFLKDPVDMHYFDSAAGGLAAIAEALAGEELTMTPASRALLGNLDGAVDVLTFAEP